MISLRVPQIGKSAAAILLLAALVFPQTIDFEKSLLWCLPAYAAIALAVLIAAATAGLDFRRDIFCFATTLAFVGYIVARALLSPAAYFARADLYCVLAVLALYGLTVGVINSAGLRFAIIVSLLAFAVWHVLVGLVQFGLGENFRTISFLKDLDVGQRASGLYIDPDHLAGLLEVLGILGLSIACWSRWPAWAKVVVGYLTLNCYFGAALTASRGGYVSITVSLIIFAGLSALALRGGGAPFFRRYGTIGSIALVAALVASGFLIRQSSMLTQRVTHIIAAEDQGRLDMWRAAIEQWKLQPLVGTGSGTFQFYGRQFRTDRMQFDPVDAHNDYLELLGDYGLIGALLFLLFFFAHIRHGLRTFTRWGPRRLAAGSLPFSNRLALNIGALCAIGAYVVHSAVDFNLHIPANALLMAFVFGIVGNPGITPEAGEARSGFATLFKYAFLILAIALLVQCFRLFPGEYYADRASTTLENENPSRAISYANKALEWEKRNPNIFFCLGRGLEALGNDKEKKEERIPYYERALAQLDKARLLAPLEVSYPLDMAFIYDHLGRFAEAEWMYAVARERDPRSVAVSQLYQNHIDMWKNPVSEDGPKSGS